MDDFDAGVRDLHERVGRLDELLRERTTTVDLSEKLAAGAHEAAEQTSRRLQLLLIAGFLVAFLWTPFTAYGAVWLHERVRNHCYPGVVYQAEMPPAEEPWYCGAFPGTGRHDNHGGP